jgi:hypothetical protein
LQRYVTEFNRSSASIEMAKQERRRLLELVHESQATFERSRDIIPRLEDILWTDPQRWSSQIKTPASAGKLTEVETKRLKGWASLFARVILTRT